MKKLTEDEFDEIYTPQINKFERAKVDKTVADEDICSFGGCLHETYGEELDYVMEMAKENRVVTIIEGEDELGEDGYTHGTVYYTSGYHMVNCMGYLVVDKPIIEEFEVKLDY